MKTIITSLTTAIITIVLFVILSAKADNSQRTEEYAFLQNIQKTLTIYYGDKTEEIKIDDPRDLNNFIKVYNKMNEQGWELFHYNPTIMKRKIK